MYEEKQLLARWDSYERKKEIQAEGAFGQLKHNRKFVRFLTAGNVKVSNILFLLAISQNIRKAIVKCNAGTLENHILQPAALLKF